MTGVARGIGKCYADALAEFGVYIAIGDIKEEGTERAPNDMASQWNVETPFLTHGCDLHRIRLKGDPHRRSTLRQTGYGCEQRGNRLHRGGRGYHGRSVESTDGYQPEGGLRLVPGRGESHDEDRWREDYQHLFHVCLHRQHPSEAIALQHVQSRCGDACQVPDCRVGRV